MNLINFYRTRHLKVTGYLRPRKQEQRMLLHKNARQYRARCFGRTKLSLSSQITDCTSSSAKVVARRATRERDSVHEETERLRHLKIKNLVSGSLQHDQIRFAARQLSYLVAHEEFFSILALDAELYARRASSLSLRITFSPEHNSASKANIEKNSQWLQCWLASSAMLACRLQTQSPMSLTYTTTNSTSCVQPLMQGCMVYQLVNRVTILCYPLVCVHCGPVVDFFITKQTSLHPFDFVRNLFHLLVCILFSC